MEISKIFGSNLKNIRSDLKLSQEKFAELIDTQARSLSDIENGKYLPTSTNIDKILEKLNMSIIELLTYNKQNFPEANNSKNEKIRLISLKLSTLDEEKINIVSNIVDSMFK